MCKDPEQVSEYREVKHLSYDYRNLSTKQQFLNTGTGKRPVGEIRIQDRRWTSNTQKKRAKHNKQNKIHINNKIKHQR